MLSTEKFLELFGHDTFTLARLSNKGMKSFPAVKSKLPAAIKYLKKENAAGAEIYFMVNEGNGILNAAKSACHGKGNVIKLSAFFLDAELDDGTDPLPNVLSFCSKHFYHPSAVVRTSANRYHCYWLFDAVEATPQNTKMWQQVQAFLHSKLSSDRTMTDTPQIMRLPGFKNNKKKFDVVVDECPGACLDFKTAFNVLADSFPELETYQVKEPLKPVTENYVVSPGERHEEILRRARKLYADPSLSDDDIKCFIDGFILSHLKDNKDFLPHGARRHEVERSLAAAKGYAETERLKEASAAITKHVEIVQKKKSEFELDPEFYYNAPGIVGDLTRHIVDTSDFPIPAHAFAAAVSLVGFTKARYIQGARKLPPLNYFLCLAPSGAGKTTVQTVLKEVLSKLHLKDYLEDGIASAQGLVQFLSNSKSLGIILYDEVKDLFQTISNKNASSYEVKIATELTKLYTAYASDYAPPTTKTHKGKKAALHKPLFSFLGYGHFTLIDTLFTKANVLEGLLPRFLILNVDERKKVTSRYAPVPDAIIDELRGYVTKSCLAIEETADAAKLPINTDPIIKTLPLNHEAAISYQAFETLTDQLYNSAVTDRNGLEALFSRGCEQSLRLSLAMSANHEIQRPIMDFSIELVKAQMQGFHHKFSETVDKTEHAKESDKLTDKIIELCSQSSDYTISKRDLQNRTYRWYKDAGLFSKHLNSLIERGVISEFEQVTAAGKKTKRIRVELPE